MSEGAPEVEARAGRSQRALERLRAAVGAEPVRADAVPDDLLLRRVRKLVRADEAGRKRRGDIETERRSGETGVKTAISLG